MKMCELQGCTSTGDAKKSVGKYQVYDGKTPTMSRPAEMCLRCINFATHCGMMPKREK